MTRFARYREAQLIKKSITFNNLKLLDFLYENL